MSGKQNLLGFMRSYTKAQAVYHGGPGSLRPIGARGVWGVAGPTPCSDSFDSLENIPSHWKPIYDPRLVRRIGCTGLVEPVSAVEDNFSSATTMPAVRFPLTERCVSCGVLTEWKNDEKISFAVSKPGKCTQIICEKRNKETRQLERVWACAAGHMDSVDISCAICGANSLKYENEDDAGTYYLRCTSCNETSALKLHSSKKCSGTIVAPCSGHTQRDVPCEKEMTLRKLGDHTVWAPYILTSLFLPTVAGFDEDVVVFVRNNYTRVMQGYEEESYEKKIFAFRSLIEYNFPTVQGLTEEKMSLLVESVSDAETPSVFGPQNEEELLAEIKQQELRQLLDSQMQGSTSHSFEVEKCLPLRDDIQSETGIIGVSPVIRLGITSVLLGASRGGSAPKSSSVLRGHCEGDTPESEYYLPAYQGFGEGLILWLSPDVFDSRTNDAVYTRMHTLSHALISCVTEHSGLGLTNIHERIYEDLENPAILLYITTGDSVGTLGSLYSVGQNFQEHADAIAKKFNRLRWCRSDPFCSEVKGGACHHCVVLPETCCENPGKANEYLNRQSLFDLIDARKSGLGILL